MTQMTQIKADYMDFQWISFNLCYPCALYLAF